MVVSPPIRICSAYSLVTNKHFIFHGAIIGSHQLEVMSRLELPEGLAQLKHGLPAGHLASDHFALGAKFHITGEVAQVGWSGTSDYISLPDDEEAVVEVDASNQKRYFL